jgi:hypothetical protein
MVLLGPCVNVGYGIIDEESSKDGMYIHDHKDGVRLYRRVRNGEKPSLSVRSFPKEQFVLGDWVGCTYLDEDGRKKEIKGSTRTLAITPDGKRLFVFHKSKGVLYLIKGGKFRITNWMYD